MSEHQTTDHETYGLDETNLSVEDRQQAIPDHGHDHGECSNDHLASIYESQTDQFESVVPFIKQGLERGERCLYVADDNTIETVAEALREGGIDVAAARESGALSFHTKADTYLETGEFEQEAMLDFWEDELTEARDEQGYAGVRAAAEMTWALDEDTGLDRLVAYEAMLNTIYEGEDYVVLCQYNRDRFPADVISDVIRSHPLVVYDGTVCQNFYYHSPDEFFDASDTSLDVDRTVDGLVSRARTKRALEKREQELRSRVQQQEVVAELGQRGLAGQDIDSLFADAVDLVAETLSADYCKVLELRDDDRLLLREGVGWQEGVVGEATVGADLHSQAGYTLLSEEPVIVDDLGSESRFSGPDLLVDHDVTSGISVVIGSVDDPWGVLGVHTRDRRDFSGHDAAFVQSVANTVATAIDRAEREGYQRQLYEVSSSTDRSFEDKLQALFDLGCERFDLDLGGLARVDPRTDLFEVEYVSGDHPDLQPGTSVDLSETYCRLHTEPGETAGVIDPADAGFSDTLAYQEFGVCSYLGTRIDIEDGDDRTLFFVSEDSRETDFSAAERTFHQLMAEWVQHEIEHREYERKLERSNDRLEQFAYAASHDLQEPLRMISSYLQLVERRYADDLDENGREFIGFAVDGADRMRQMIDGLLEYSRVETQGEPFEAVELAAVVDDVRTDLTLQIDESGAEITTGSLPRVEGDPNQLRQLFQNLLDNAIEYSGDEPPRVDITAERRGDEWLVSVSDEGIGIDADQTDRIFEIFQRLHAHDEYSGTGIGLALCQRIVERHGGEIRVESEPDVGSTFSFTLPAVDDED